MHHPQVVTSRFGFISVIACEIEISIFKCMPRLGVVVWHTPRTPPSMSTPIMGSDQLYCRGYVARREKDLRQGLAWRGKRGNRDGRHCGGWVSHTPAEASLGQTPKFFISSASWAWCSKGKQRSDSVAVMKQNVCACLDILGNVASNRRLRFASI